MGRHTAPEVPPPPRNKPRYRFLVAFSAIFLLAFATMAVVAAVFPEKGPQAEAAPETGLPFPDLSHLAGTTPDAVPTASNGANASTGLPPDVPTGLVTGTFAISQDWGQGFIASVQLTNTDTTATAWQVRLVFPANVGVLDGKWLAGGPGDAAVNRQGQTVTFTGQQALAAGARVGLFFQFQKTVGNVNPSECSVNGRPCGS